MTKLGTKIQMYLSTIPILVIMINLSSMHFCPPAWKLRQVELWYTTHKHHANETKIQFKKYDGKETNETSANSLRGSDELYGSITKVRQPIFFVIGFQLLTWGKKSL